MRVLLTNDDGIESKGLIRLARVIWEVFPDTFVVAPSEDKSGSGAAIGPLLHDGNVIDYDRVELPGLSGLSAYAIDGTPALGVILSNLGAFGDPPDMVVSGINPGSNTGKSVLHSGTAGAALTAASFGITGVAVSIVARGRINWDTAARLGAVVASRATLLPKGVMINLNVPNLPMDEIKDIVPAKLAHFGSLRTELKEAQPGKLHVLLKSTSDSDAGEATDVTLLRDNYATITVVSGLRVIDSVAFSRAVVDEISGA